MSPDSITRILGRAHFLIVPANHGNRIPSLVVDAFSMALPVVAARSEAISELVQQDRTGLLFEPGNADNLAGVVALLTKTRALHDRMSESARAAFTERLSPEKSLATLLEVYRTALKSQQT